MSAQFYNNISVEELAVRLAELEPELQLIDVREPAEVARSISRICNIAVESILFLGQYDKTTF